MKTVNQNIKGSNNIQVAGNYVSNKKQIKTLDNFPKNNIIEHFYSCILTLGNDSVFETETLKKELQMFLSAFGIKKSTFKKKHFPDEKPTGYYYEIELSYKNDNFLQVIRFSESLQAFCMHQHIQLYEHLLQ
jgi:hypothetical protein